MPSHESVRLDERSRTFVAFWLAAALSLFALGIAVLVAVSHGHRLGALLLLLAIISLAISLVVLRAGRRGD